MKSPQLTRSAPMDASTGADSSEGPIPSGSASTSNGASGGDGASAGIGSTAIGLIVGVVLAAVVAALAAAGAVLWRKRAADSYDYFPQAAPGSSEMSHSVAHTDLHLLTQTNILTLNDTLRATTFEADLFEMGANDL
jgi:hypothetical protein